MTTAPDAELLARAAAADASAFGLVIDRYAPQLYDFAARLTRDRDEAFEVVRETLLVAQRVVRAGAAPAHFRVWLFGLARSNVLAIVEGQPPIGTALSGRGEPDGPLDIVGEGELQGKPADEAAAIAPATWEAFAGLDTRQLSMLLLNVRAGLSPTETAEAAGMHGQNGELVLGRLRRAAENAAWARIFLRDPARQCPELATIVAGLPARTLTPASRRLISRHLASCPKCTAARDGVPSPVAIFAAFAPAALPDSDRAALRAGILAEFVAPVPRKARALLAPVTSAPGPRLARVFAAFVGLACVAGVLGGLLLIPSSPIALTRDRTVHEPPAAVQPPPPPTVIFVTPTNTPSPTASPTPSVSPTATAVSATPSPTQLVVAPPNTPTPEAETTATDTPSPTPSPTPSVSATPDDTPTGPSPTPGEPGDCTPSLSTNVRQVNIAGGSSSFTVFNSFCRAVQFSIDVAQADDWLHLQQDFGTLDPGGFSTIGITADRSELPEGTTMGSITITWVDGSLEIPVAATVAGGAPIVGPVQATCAPENQANFFTARVIDDYGVTSVTLTTVAPDGTSTDIPMTLANGDARAGSWAAEPAGGIASYQVTAADAAGHTATFPGSCQTG